MKPKRTKQIAGMIVGALFTLLSPTLAFWGMRLALMMRGDPGTIDLHRFIYAGVSGSVASISGLLILIISIVNFIRLGRAAQKA